MSSSKLARLDVFLVSAATIIIIFAIGITAAVQGQPEKPFSQIITVGPVWTLNSWSCTSDADFMVYGTVRALERAQLTIAISDLGTQALYTFDPSDLYSFSVGGPAGHTMTLTRSGTVTGWITLQTTSDATASCTQQ